MNPSTGENKFLRAPTAPAPTALGNAVIFLNICINDKPIFFTNPPIPISAIVSLILFNKLIRPSDIVLNILSKKSAKENDVNFSFKLSAPKRPNTNPGIVMRRKSRNEPINNLKASLTPPIKPRKNLLAISFSFLDSVIAPFMNPNNARTGHNSLPTTCPIPLNNTCILVKKPKNLDNRPCLANNSFILLAAFVKIVVLPP